MMLPFVVLLAHSSWQPTPQTTPSPATVQQAEALGLSPAAAVVAGLSPAQAVFALNQLAQNSQLEQALSAAQQAAESAAAQLVAVRAQLRETPTNAELITQALQLGEQCQSTQASVRAARTNLLAAALQGLPEASASRLGACVCGSFRQVPLEFTVAERTPESWKSIEGALVVERRALRLGETVPQSAADLLATVRAEPAVVEAHNALANQLAAMQVVFGY